MPAPPPLLHTRAAPAEFAAAVVVPLVFGGVVGLTLGWSEPVYLVLLLIALLGGAAAGYEHDVPAEGLYRGILGGLVFTTGLLVAHGVSGADPEADLPDPEALLLIINTVISAGTGTLGAVLRRRREGRAQSSSPVPGAARTERPAA